MDLEQIQVNSQSYVSGINFSSDQLTFYFSAIFIPIGIITNSLTAILFLSNKNLNKTNMGFLYGLLSSVETMSLLVDFFLLQFMPQINKLFSLQLQSDFFCKIVTFFVRIVTQGSYWLLTYISIDRYIHVRYPNRYPLLHKRKVIGLIFMLMLAFLCLLNMENLFYYLSVVTGTFDLSSLNQTNQTNRNNNTNNSGLLNAMASSGSGSGSGSTSVIYHFVNNTEIVTVLSCTADNRFLFAADMLGALARTWFPIIIITFYNVLTIKQIVKSKKRINLKNLKRENQYTLTILALNILFFVLNFPLSIAYLLSNLYRYYPGIATSEYLARINFFFSVSLSLAYLYQSVTFFVIFSLNSFFRKEFMLIIYKIFRPSAQVDHFSTSDKTGTHSSHQLPDKTKTTLYV